MSKLTVFKDKNPKEVARLLSVVSSSLLPNPGIGEVILQTGIDTEFVKAVLSEVRGYLRISEGDFSPKAQSQIYAFLSEEISRAALANVNMSNLKARLGNKGELHPSQYQVSFAENFEATEILGTKKSYVVEAITHPDKVTHLRSKSQQEDNDPRVTLTTKFVDSKRADDRFILFVISSREGQVQEVTGALRAYLSDVDLNDANEPVDVVRSFVNVYGLTFHIGDSVSKFMHNEVVRIDSTIPRVKQIKPVEGQPGDYYLPYISGADSSMRGMGTEILAEVVLAFVINISKYIATLRRHNVHLSPEAEWHRFPRI